MYIDGRGFEIFGHFVNWYGVIIACGMALGVLLGLKLAKKRGFKADTVIDIALVCIPSAIIGARLYYVIFYEHDYTFVEMFKIWEGGLAIYGGVIGGAIGLTVYCLIKKINFLKIADVVVPCLILGQAIGRWGNFTNHEAYGRLITDPNWQFFPVGVLIERNNFTTEAIEMVQNAFGTIPDSAWFMATFFYESLWNFMVLGLLLLIFYKTNVKGLTMCGYFVLYGLGRVWIEGLRMDSLYFLGLRVSQWLSLVLIIVFGAIAVYLIYKAKKRGETIIVWKNAVLAGVSSGGGQSFVVQQKEQNQGKISAQNTKNVSKICNDVLTESELNEHNLNIEDESSAKANYATDCGAKTDAQNGGKNALQGEDNAQSSSGVVNKVAEKFNNGATGKTAKTKKNSKTANDDVLQ